MQSLRAFVSLSVLGFLVLFLADCNPSQFGGLGAAACPQLNGDPFSASFSANATANGKIKSFVVAAKSLMNVSAQMEAMTTEACQRMGADLGIPPQAMAAQSDEPGAKAQAACGAVSGQIDAILRQGVQVQVQVWPPQCQANLQAKAQCDGACNVQVDPGQIVAQCEPAKLSGFCQGRCTGQCEGVCNGQCNGQCSAQDAQGNCAGQCNGTCNGSCSATCHARCEGQWQAPKCEGSIQGPSADAECNASCNASANLNAQCTPAQVRVMGTQNFEMAARLMATLQANLPQLLTAQIGFGKRILADAKVVVDVGAQLPKVVGDAGAQGLACIAAAANASVTASARINVSVQASASVSGKVGAGG